MRTAPHPWGAAHVTPKQSAAARDSADTAEEVGWSSAEALLTREMAAPYMGCASDGPQTLPGCQKPVDEFQSLSLLKALGRAVTGSAPLREVATDCIGGAIARKAQDWMSGDSIGRLYAPNIIDEWTQDVTDEAQRKRGERSVELYWNVSTWNPYQVVLFKTQLNKTSESSSLSRNRVTLVRSN